MGERRVPLVPETVARFIKDGHEVMIEHGAGCEAMIGDDEYVNAGAKVVEGRVVRKSADVLFVVRGPGIESHSDLDDIRPGTVLIGLFQPLTESLDYFDVLKAKQFTVFSMDSIPRISRSQSMDVLSSMSTIAGYRAVLIAAEKLGKFFPLLMTAAGTIPPAKVLVLGAGVAGLQAVATARRLGAVVQAFDTRPVVREQVESLGAQFLTLDVTSEQTTDGYATALADDIHNRELQALRGPVSESDVVITTALIPGQKAPILITREMVKQMRPGAVIVDLAGESGGNCELSRPGETVVEDSVTIVTPLNVPSQLALNASQLYARNLMTFFNHAVTQGLTVTDERTTRLDFSDEIVKRTCLISNGEIINEGLQNRFLKVRD